MGVCLSPFCFYYHENIQEIYTAFFDIIYSFADSRGRNRLLDDGKWLCSIGNVRIPVCFDVCGFFGYGWIVGLCCHELLQKYKGSLR